jgi:hypothetical protein
MLKIGWKGCPYCGDHEVDRSKTEPRTWLVRCHQCEYVTTADCSSLRLPAYPHPIRAQKWPRTDAGDEESKRSA